MRITAASYLQLGEKVFPSAASRVAAGGSASAKATAKVTTTSFGFKLGKFGLDFTSRDVEIEPVDEALQADSFRRTPYERLQSESVDVENVRRSMASADRRRDASSMTGMKDALKAYMQAAGLSEQTGGMRMNLGIA